MPSNRSYRSRSYRSRSVHPRMSVRWRIAGSIGIVITMAITMSACGGNGSTPADTTSTTAAPPARTIVAPGTFGSIQAAVDDARPGDMVLIDPGTYTEAITVETNDITLRGADRNTTILDGDNRLENGVMVLSDGVAVENLTARRFRSNGVLFTGDYAKGRTLSGYRASYVTAANNGLYGIYAFNARGGTIDHIYASGHPDAGIYIGQCQPCDAVIRDSVAEFNAAGFQGTNAGGQLVIVSNVWRHNRVGVEPNSSAKEKLAPQADTDIVGNVIVDNSEPRAPKATEAFGVGVAVGGGSSNRIERNLITGHASAGVAIIDQDGFLADGNRVIANTLSGNRTDLVISTADGATRNNCFATNIFTTSAPVDIESRYACAPESRGGQGQAPAAAAPGPVPYQDIALPGPQETMPDPGARPASPAGSPNPPDLSSITTPAAPT